MQIKVYIVIRFSASSLTLISFLFFQDCQLEMALKPSHHLKEAYLGFNVQLYLHRLPEYKSSYDNRKSSGGHSDHYYYSY